MSSTFRNRFASSAFAALLFFAVGFCSFANPAWADDSQGLNQQVIASEQVDDQQAVIGNPDEVQEAVEADFGMAGNLADEQESIKGQETLEDSSGQQATNDNQEEAGQVGDGLEASGEAESVALEPGQGVFEPDEAQPAENKDLATEGTDVTSENKEADQAVEDSQDSADSTEPELAQGSKAAEADQDEQRDAKSQSAAQEGQSAPVGSVSGGGAKASASSAPTASDETSSSAKVDTAKANTVPKTEVKAAKTSTAPNESKVEDAKPAASSESAVDKSTKQDPAASSGTRPTSAKLAKAKNRINTGLIRGSTTINLDDLKLGFSYKSDLTSTVFRLFDEAILDNPGIVVSQYYLYTYYSSGYYYADKLSDIIYGKVITDEINDAITDMVSWAPEGASQAEQAKAVHDWLVRNCMYNNPATLVDQHQYKLSHYDNPWTASGALTYPYKPVCAGYSAAFAAAMKRLGIPCTVVSNTDANHAWNRVKIDGEWYNVDVTWDDPLNRDKRGDAGYNATPDTTYFLKSDAYFKSIAYIENPAYTHSKWDTEATDPAATSTLYDYWNWGSYSYSYYHGYIYDLQITSSASIGTDGRKTLGLKINYGDADNKPFHTYTWSSNNKTIAVVTQFGTVTSGTKLGKAIITCSAEGCSDTCTVWVVGGSIQGKTLSRSVKNRTFTYNGKRHVPTLKITHKLSNATYTLKSGTNYTVSYQNAKGKAIASSKIINAGTYYLVVRGKGLYSGTLKYKFVINRASIAKAKVTGVKSRTYNGKVLSQSKIVVKLGSKTLKRGTHYTVGYRNAKGKAIKAASVVNAGTYYVVIAGKGNYAKSLKRSFKISRAPITKGKITGVKAVMFKGKSNAQTKIVVKYGGKTLKRGTHYTVSYLNSKGKAVAASKIQAGTYYVVVKGKGNYGSSKSVKYRVIYRPVWAGASRIPVNAYSKAVSHGTVRVLAGGKYLRVSKNKVDIVGKAASGKSYATVGVYDSLGRLYAKKKVKVYRLSGDYVIQSAMKSSLVLDIEGVSKRNGARMIVWTRNGGANQKFSFKAMKDGTYAIRCAHSGKYVDVDGASKDKGHRVIQWKWNGGDNQRWRIRVDSANRLTFVSKNSGYVFDGNGAQAVKGRDMIQWPFNNGNNQKWVLKRK